MNSIEWLIEQLQAPCRGIPSHIIEQAKEMHKAEILAAFTEGANDGYDGCYDSNREKYYNETFGSKDINGNEIKFIQTLKDYHIVDTNEMVHQVPDVRKMVKDDVKTTTSDLIDSAIWSLPFEERMKCWDLIEKLVEEEKETLYTEEQLKLAYMQGYNRGKDGNPNHMESYIQFLKQHKQ